MKVLLTDGEPATGTMPSADQARRQIGFGQRFVDHRIDPRGDSAWYARRRDHAYPGCKVVEALDAGFCHGEHIGNVGMTRCNGDGDGFKAFDVHVAECAQA